MAYPAGKRAIATLNAAKPLVEGRQILIHKGVIGEVGRRIHERSVPDYEANRWLANDRQCLTW